MPDWYMHGKDVDVWYYGEYAKDFEGFNRDDPRLPEIVSINGAFKVGRDGAIPGIQFWGFPMLGKVYLFVT